ncbi:MAG: site-2 protease family protein [Candidatus Bathyarchaeia archaeon]
MSSYRITEPVVEEAIERRFIVEDRFYSMNLPVFIVKPQGEGDPRQLLKKEFEHLAKELSMLNYYPRLTREANRYHITIIPKPQSRPQSYTKNLILLIATAGTIFIDGFLRSNNPILTEALMPGVPVFLNALLFMIAILGVFGMHELGHKLLAMKKGVEASMPYFIPAPPGMGGTFGAVITQKEPPVNRDALFDLGLSGPLVGFIVTMFVAVLGFSLSFSVPLNMVDEWMMKFPEVRFQSIPFPLILEFLASIFKSMDENMVLILHPVGFAAWVGCLVTFINLTPSWQLDGGHISRAVFGEMNHKIISVAGILLLLISGYFIMAIMIAFFMMRTGGDSGGPLDDVSPLSLSRKLLFSVYLAMMALTLIVLFPL